MTAVWPRDVLVPASAAAIWTPRTTSGSIALSGFRQVVASDAGGWLIKMERVAVRNQAAIRAWYEMALLLEGRLNPVLVPVWPAYPVAEDEFFSDGTGHDVDAPPTASLSGDHALRATTVAINVTYGGALAPGDFFSIGERLYQVRSITSVAGTVNTVTARPPLRAAASNGTAVNLNTPACKCRLRDDSMELMLDASKTAFPSISFIEDPT